MKVIKKKISTCNKTCAIILASKNELELLSAIVTKAETHTPKLHSTEIILGRIKSMRIAVNKALGCWDELPISEKI